MDRQRREELTQLRDGFAQQLRQEREALLREVADDEADLRTMESERTSELEERAQAARATRLFARLDERRKQRIDGIDRALQRIALGTYGICERCGEPIRLARLRALPTARRHVQCTTGEEGPPLMTEEERTLAVGEAETLIAAGQEEEPSWRSMNCSGNVRTGRICQRRWSPLPTLYQGRWRRSSRAIKRTERTSLQRGRSRRKPEA